MKLALRKLVKSRRKKNFLDLVGQIQFVPDFDYKALRETRQELPGILFSRDPRGFGDEVFTQHHQSQHLTTLC
jgi:hypothetical protein